MDDTLDYESDIEKYGTGRPTPWTDPTVLHWYRNPEAFNIHTEPCLDCDKTMAEGNHRPPRRSVVPSRATINEANALYAEQTIANPLASVDAKAEAHRFLAGPGELPEKEWLIMRDLHDIDTGAIVKKDHSIRLGDIEAVRYTIEQAEKNPMCQNIRIYEYTPKLISSRDL